jgi:hypothetical protein
MPTVVARGLWVVLPLLVLCAAAWAQPRPQPAGVGIGVEVTADGTVLIRSLAPGGPAEGAGVKTGDELIAVDGRRVADVTVAQLADALRGRDGRDVALTVRTRGAPPRTVTVRRTALTTPPPGGTATPASGLGQVRFTRVSVTDPGMDNVEAVSFLVPATWKTEGGVHWLPNHSVLANLLLRVTDPETGAVIEFLPIQNFTWLTEMVVPMQPGTNYLGNILWPPITDPHQFIQTFYGPQAATRLRGARLVSSEDLPGIAAEVSRRDGGGAGQVKAARVRYEYAREGKAWEEDVYVTLAYPPPMGPISLWSVRSAHSFRAPKAQLDRMTPLMNTTVLTLRLSPEWYGGYMWVQKLFIDRMHQSIRSAAAISQTIRENSEEIRRMFADSYRRQAESQDRISQRYTEYIRGVEAYRDPHGNRPVWLPSGYTHAWANARGEYLLSNQPGFDPNVGDAAEWRRMEPP